MRSKKTEKIIYNITTLGCSKNLVDSEQLARQIQAGSNSEILFEEYDRPYDISLINTCGFIDKAKDESIQTIIEHINKKKRGELKKVFVFGCLSERYKEEMKKAMPEIDNFFGTGELPFILHSLDIDYKQELLGERVLSQAKHYAYLKIAEGCNRTCSFCAIPQMRGSFVSKPIEMLEHEATMLVQSGVKELLLIAQELTYYGLDIYKKRALPNLLDKLSNIDGLEWIRLHYTYPSKFPLEILDTIKNNEKICNYIDIPLQHASDNILQRMKRQITQEEQQKLIDTIREKIRSVAIRTTMMIGFPGETKKDFQTLKTFVERNKFERLGVFTYSHEDKTSAFGFRDNIPQKVKADRAKELMMIQRDISHKINARKVGTTEKIMIDKQEGNIYIGRTQYDSIDVDNEVIIRTEKKLTPGDIVQAKIINASEYDLEAELV